jgi:hypothetical protein
MNILCDYHHGELYESIQKVFEDRFGGQVYRPIGTEWHDRGYWKIGTLEAQIGQYLGYDFSTEIEDGIWAADGNWNKEYYNNVMNVFGRSPDKCVTFEKAMDMDWDIIISTLYGHFDPMEDFRLRNCPNAKHILQLGNVVTCLPERAKNVLNSTGISFNSPGNYLEYNQEFDTSVLSWNPESSKSVYCFLINNQGHCGQSFWDLEAALDDDWEFREYGACNKHKNIHKYDEQCKRMRECSFLWHVKLNGDGYGYNLYRGMYAGKIPILNLSFYGQHHRLGKSGFLQDGVNCINYEIGTPIDKVHDSVQTLYSNWESTSKTLCDGMRQMVDFDREAENIRKFIDNLI